MTIPNNPSGNNANNLDDVNGADKTDKTSETNNTVNNEKTEEINKLAKANARGPMRPAAGIPTEKAKDFKGALKKLLGRLRPQRLKITLVMLLIGVSVACNVAGPKLLAHVTDLIFSGFIGKQVMPNVTVAGQHLPNGLTSSQLVEMAQRSGISNPQLDMAKKLDFVIGRGIDFTRMGQWILIALAVYGAGVFMNWLANFILADVTAKVMYRLRSDVEEKTNRLPLGYFDTRSLGDILSRVTNDLDNLNNTLQQTFSQLMSSFLTIVGVLAMMFWLSPLLAVISLFIVPASALVAAVVGKQSKRQFVAQWRHTGVLTGTVEETFAGHDLVKVFGRQAETEAYFRDTNEKVFSASYRAQFISGMIMPIMAFLGNMNFVIIAVVGGLKVATGQMSLGDVQAFIQYSRQFTQPLSQAASMMNMLQSGLASAERVFEVLDATEQVPEKTEGHLPSERKGRVEFHDISFSYTQDKPLIEHLSLVAEPGQTVAIVGPTGAGKTTLVNLIMRFYELNSGRITLDGVDTTDIPRSELRGETGMVLQDAWLFGGTIRDNIAYGKPGATKEEIITAAKATYVDRFVHSLPDGYDTIIDEEASNISSGEKQLLTIARAFISDPALLILDEATSSVDTRTEVLVQKAMAALRSDRTSFVIAHRLSTIRDADLILVMQEGSIVEQGNHDQLLAQRGAYYDLYSAQFSSALDEEVAGAAI